VRAAPLLARYQAWKLAATVAVLLVPLLGAGLAFARLPAVRPEVVGAALLALAMVALELSGGGGRRRQGLR
jgi:hypothetical protein